MKDRRWRLPRMGYSWLAPGAPGALTWFGSVSRAFLTRCVGAVASLGYGVLLADVLAPSAMGEFVLAVSVALIAATFAKCGLDVYTLRRAAERPEVAWRVASRCVAVAGLAGALFWIGSVAIGSEVRPASARMFGVLHVAIPFLAMCYVLAGLLKARDYPAAAVFLETGGWQSAMCVCAIAMRLAGSDSLLLVAVCFAGGSALIFTGSVTVARRLTFGSGPFTPRRTAPDAVRIREVAPFAALSVCNVLIRWSDTLWLGWWIDVQAVAVYAVCTRLAGAIAFIGHAVNTIAAPRFARHQGREQVSVLRTEFRRACAASGIFAILSVAAIALVGSFILAFLGPPYSDSTGILWVAATLMALRVTLMPVGHLAEMSGRAVDHLKGAGAMLALQQVAYLLLIPRFGMAAALVGYALPQALAMLFTLALLRRRREFGWLAR